MIVPLYGFRINNYVHISGYALSRMSESKNTSPKPYDDKVKTAPKGYPKDHPHIDLLRYKSFIYMRQFSDKEAQSVDFPKMIIETFKAMKPYVDFLRRGLD